MKTITQNFKTGVLNLTDIPVPMVGDEEILVRTHASLISIGTDKSVISLGKKNSISKAIARPDLANKVISKVKRDGFWSTFKTVQNLISEPKPLGYSLVGTVIQVGKNIDDISVGDRVSCSGAGYANHSEIVSVPKNLCSIVPKGVSDEQAAYATLGAIAMHGVRQANQQIGASVLVVGLGLVGQLTVQLCVASGFNVFGTDLDSTKIKLSLKNGAKMGSTPFDLNFQNKIQKMTNGLGVDSVLLTVGSKESGAIFEQVAQVCRDRARVVVVGDVKMDINRKSFFEKELEIYQSRSYGPGRYDKNYEEKGHDYPIGYVRWTEKRNISSFLNLINDNKIDPSNLTTHRFQFKDSIEAYNFVLKNKNDFIVGVILEYDLDKKIQKNLKQNKNTEIISDKISLGLVGVGNFAKSVLLPELLASKKFQILSVSSNKGLSSKMIFDKYGVENAYSEPDSLFNNKDINAVVICTRHDSHSQYVVKALEKNKHVYVEKPLAINRDQLESIKRAVSKSEATLTVGFNRRYSKPIIDLKKYFEDRTEPMSMLYRVNAGRVLLGSEQSWIHDENIGGGRIIGECCHFIDTMQFICDSLPVSVQATTVKNHQQNISNKDNLSFTISFEDGSIGTVHYWSNGSSNFAKEKIEVFCNEKIGILNNFKNIELVSNQKVNKKNYYSQDKGFRGEIDAFIDSCKTQKQSISIESLIKTTETTFLINELIQNID